MTLFARVALAAGSDRDLRRRADHPRLRLHRRRCQGVCRRRSTGAPAASRLLDIGSGVPLDRARARHGSSRGCTAPPIRWSPAPSAMETSERPTPTSLRRTASSPGGRSAPLMTGLQRLFARIAGQPHPQALDRSYLLTWPVYECSHRRVTRHRVDCRNSVASPSSWRR